MGNLARKVAIIGAGMNKFGRNFPQKRNPDMWIDAWLEAVTSVHTGIEPKDIDACYVGNYSSDLFNHQGHLGPQMANLVGLTPKPAPRFEGACASSGIALRQAIIAVASGIHDVIAVAGMECMNELPTALVTDTLATASDSLFEYTAGATFPGLYATIATAHFKKYGTTPEDLMRVGIKNHKNGAENPYAQMQQTIKQIMEKKISRLTKEGKPAPDWKDEFDFLKSSPLISDDEEIDLLDNGGKEDMKRYFSPVYMSQESVERGESDDNGMVEKNVKRGRVTICMDKKLWERFKQHAVKNNKKYSHLLEEIIRKHLKG